MDKNLNMDKLEEFMNQQPTVYHIFPDDGLDNIMRIFGEIIDRKCHKKMAEITELQEDNALLNKAFAYQSSLFAGFSAKHDAEVIENMVKDVGGWVDDNYEAYLNTSDVLEWANRIRRGG